MTLTLDATDHAALTIESLNREYIDFLNATTAAANRRAIDLAVADSMIGQHSYLSRRAIAENDHVDALQSAISHYRAGVGLVSAEVAACDQAECCSICRATTDAAIKFTERTDQLLRAALKEEESATIELDRYYTDESYGAPEYHEV